MRQFVSVVIIQSFSSRDLNEFREIHRHQLFRRVERNDSSDKSSSPSKQLIIEDFIEK